VASCGDGVVYEGVEECDDGNDVPDDGCSDLCIRDRLVFVTDDPLAPGGFKSLFGADNVCRKTAMDYGYANFESFKAWLSDDEASPADRFFHSEGRYVLVTGEAVAESWEDLVDGELLTGIDRSLSGEEISESAVWTATQTNGEGWGDGQTCESWSSTDPQDTARWGISGYADGLWTDGGDGATCVGGGHLYCFEQE
jgi:cysteine-rich repeat protein